MVESYGSINIKERNQGVLADNCILKDNVDKVLLISNNEELKLFQDSIAKKQPVYHDSKGKGKPQVTFVDSHDPWINRKVDFANEHVIASTNGEISSVKITNGSYNVTFSDKPYRDNEYNLIVIDNLASGILQPFYNENFIVEQRVMNDNDNDFIDCIRPSNLIIEQRPINNNYFPKKQKK